MCLVVFNLKVESNAFKGVFLMYSVCPQNKKTCLSFEVPLFFQKKLFFPRKWRNRFCLRLAFFQSSSCEKFEIQLVDSSFLVVSKILQVFKKIYLSIEFFYIFDFKKLEKSKTYRKFCRWYIFKNTCIFWKPLLLSTNPTSKFPRSELCKKANFKI